MKMAELTDVDRAEAREKFLEYKRAVRGRQDEEMAQIMRGYKAMAAGHPVIDIAATIRAGGSVDVARRRWNMAGELVSTPALAAMRADCDWCWVSVGSDGHVRFDGDERPASNARRNVVRLPPGTVAGEHLPKFGTRQEARALVPPVPPRFRPSIALGNFHILWEAEWEPCAPKDPALLRHIGGDLYVVLAQWDLTELERTVLAGRFR